MEAATTGENRKEDINAKRDPQSPQFISHYGTIESPQEKIEKNGLARLNFIIFIEKMEPTFHISF